MAAPVRSRGGLEGAWAALRRAAWQEARAAFETALERGESAEAREGLAWAAFWLGDIDMVFTARERAYQLYRAAGDSLSAARVAMWIATDHVDLRGEGAVANGWFRRARRLLAGLEPAPEHGWLAVHEAYLLIEENDVVAVRQLGATAAELGRTLASPELEAMGMATEGLALVTEGRVLEGMGLLDEAATAALGGEFAETWAVPWACCYLISACERVRDLERAEQWCRKVEEYAERTGMEFLWGVCRAHHAGVLIWQGAWDEAERELSDAAESLERSRRPWGAETTVRLAELRRRQGRLREAEALFGLAEGHPLAAIGLAELHLDRMEWAAAADSARRLLRKLPSENTTERLQGLQLHVRALAGLGDPAAGAVLAELEAHAALVPTPIARATASYCAGIVATGAGELPSAQRRFEDAVDLYVRARAPYEEARARIQLALVQAETGRSLAAREAARARDILVRLGASREAKRAAALLASPGDGLGVTAREREILGLVARGLTDAEIAAALTLSRHTVHRHMANVLRKLGCSSRAAAIARAGAHGLLDLDATA